MQGDNDVTPVVEMRSWRDQDPEGVKAPLGW